MFKLLMLWQVIDRLRGRTRERVEERTSGWSVRRRWVVFVAVPVLLLCCCGTPVAVAVTWFVGETIDAGKGQPSPTAAANAYLLAMSYGQTEGLPPLLADDHQDQLMRQWQAYRQSMADAPSGAPDRFEIESLTEGPARADQVPVTAQVAVTWWPDGGGALSMRSSLHTWTITTRKDGDGWRVVRVDAPPWCGPGGYVSTCVRPPTSTSSASASPSPSPSEDLLRNPREMLRCGPRDPFREYHDCPPLPSPS